MSRKYNKETHTFEEVDNVVWIHRKMENVLEEAMNLYDGLASRNKVLEDENARLKDEAYKDKELARMKEENEKMKAALYRGFDISEEEDKKINEFISQYHGQKFGAIGGAFEYRFIPTSIGTSGVIIGPDGKEFQFREIS